MRDEFKEVEREIQRQFDKMEHIARRIIEQRVIEVSLERKTLAHFISGNGTWFIYFPNDGNMSNLDDEDIDQTMNDILDTYGWQPAPTGDIRADNGVLI